eukprot:18776_4
MRPASSAGLKLLVYEASSYFLKALSEGQVRRRAGPASSQTDLIWLSCASRSNAGPQHRQSASPSRRPRHLFNTRS